MKLFYMPGACSLAAHVVLRWTGTSHESVRVKRRDLDSPSYLALNPVGTVPLLVHDDLLLPQTAAILCYLAELHPEHALLGDGTPRSRAEVMRWLSFLSSDVHKAFRPIFYPERFLRDEAQAADLAATARDHVQSLLSHVEVQLRSQGWLTGTRSIADAYLFVMLRWALSAKVGLQGQDRLSEFLRRMHADPDVHAALVVDEGLSAYLPPSSDPGRPVLMGRGAEDTTHLIAEVVGKVEYREGEGVLLEVRRGRVDIALSSAGVVIGWSDENYHGTAALPAWDFHRYAESGAIVVLHAGR